MHVKTLGKLIKLEDRSKEMVFLGYERGTKGYRCFDPTTHKVHLSCDVIIEEEQKWNFMEGQLSEDIVFADIYVLGVNLWT